MAQSLSQILLHLIFSTKNRAPLISADIEAHLFAYMATCCRNLGCEVYKIGGTENHVHIACTLPRTMTVSKLMEEAKATSSKWIKTQGAHYQDFAWQAGYGVFSLGQSQLETLINYINKQKKHHVKQTFQEEYLMLLKKYDVPYDDRYIWSEK